MPRKPRLTDAERHKRFVETAREIGAEESKAAFDRAFKKVARTQTGPQGKASPKPG